MVTLMIEIWVSYSRSLIDCGHVFIVIIAYGKNECPKPDGLMW